MPSPSSQPSAIEPDDRVGHQIDALFVAAAGQGLTFGPRDRLAVFRVVTAGLVEARDISDLKSLLLPVLARSPAERESVSRLIDGLSTGKIAEPGPISDTSGGSEEADEARLRIPGWLSYGLLACVMALLVFLAFVIWRGTFEEADQKPGREVVQQGPVIQPDRPNRVAPPELVAPVAKKTQSLERILRAGTVYSQAPTIDELVRFFEGQGGWGREGYAICFQELTGLPRRVPLPLLGLPEAPEAAGRDGRLLAKLVLALERIEQPGRDPSRTPETVLAEARSALAEPAFHVPELYRIAQAIPRLLGDRPPGPDETRAALVSRIQEAWVLRQAGVESGGSEGGEGRESGGARLLPDAFTVERALAITPDAAFRRVYPDAHWLRTDTPPTATGVPAWVAWVALLIPAGLAAAWWLNALAFRKAYLRRRPPRTTPEHLRLVADRIRSVEQSHPDYRRLAQKLAARTTVTRRDLDIAKTIAKTLSSGGEVVQPVEQIQHTLPDYVVLIERQTSSDQSASYHRNLVRRIEGLVHLHVYYYRDDPAHLEPDDPRSEPVSLATLAIQRPDHRLVVIGSGRGFVDTRSGQLAPSGALLTRWGERALLTPTPLAEWGKTEFDIARELEMPVGRATVEGLLGLADMLGLDGAPREDLIDTRGDELANPLPEPFRLRPLRLVYAEPPSDMPAGQVVRELRNFLDPEAFEWLSALAVSPEIKWDLTLYLGAALAETAPRRPSSWFARVPLSYSASGKPLYSERALSQLMRLPWLREGVMPNWLRRALIETLSTDREREVRGAIRELLEAASAEGRPALDNLQFRITRDRSQRELAEAFDDDVLLDFMARGEIQDLDIRKPEWLKRLPLAEPLNRLSFAELAAGAVAICYGLAAYFLAPRHGEGETPATAGWAPLLIVFAGAVFALVVANPDAAYRRVRGGLIWAMPMALALVLAVVLIPIPGELPSNFFLIYKPSFLDILLSTSVAVAFTYWAMAFFGLCFQRRIKGWFTFLLGLAFSVLILSAVTFAVFELVFATGVFWQPPTSVGASPTFAGSLKRLELYASNLWPYAAAGIGVFLLGLLALRMPSRLPSGGFLLSGRRGPDWAGGALRVALALVPLVPAAWLSYEVSRASVVIAKPGAEITARAADYNEHRPHSALGYLTPVETRKALSSPTPTATGRSAAIREVSAARPVARDEQDDNFNPRSLVTTG